MMILLRLCPLIPFTFVNFAIGITCMKMSDYCIGMLAMIPATIAYVFLGTTVSNIHDAITGKTNISDNTTMYVFVIIGSIMAIGGLIWISIVARRYLNQIL